MHRLVAQRAKVRHFDIGFRVYGAGLNQRQCAVSSCGRGRWYGKELFFRGCGAADLETQFLKSRFLKKRKEKQPIWKRTSGLLN